METGRLLMKRKIFIWISRQKEVISLLKEWSKQNREESSLSNSLWTLDFWIHIMIRNRSMWDQPIWIERWIMQNIFLKLCFQTRISLLTTLFIHLTKIKKLHMWTSKAIKTSYFSQSGVVHVHIPSNSKLSLLRD